MGKEKEHLGENLFLSPPQVPYMQKKQIWPDKKEKKNHAHCMLNKKIFSPFPYIRLIKIEKKEKMVDLSDI